MTDGEGNAGTPPAQGEVKTTNDLVIEELRKQNALLMEQNKKLSDANTDLWALLHPANDKQIVVNKEPEQKKSEPYDIVGDVMAKMKAL